MEVVGRANMRGARSRRDFILARFRVLELCEVEDVMSLEEVENVSTYIPCWKLWLVPR